jgi:hypothetical protein
MWRCVCHLCAGASAGGIVAVATRCSLQPVDVLKALDDIVQVCGPGFLPGSGCHREHNLQLGGAVWCSTAFLGTAAAC